MLYYRFAGLNVKIDGMDHAGFLRERLADYQVSRFEQAHITIEHQEPAEIEKPEGRVIVSKALRSWITTQEGGYGIFDKLPNSERLMSRVVVDRDWTNIQTALLDIVDIGGSPNEIRCFNMLSDLMKHVLLAHSGLMIHASAIGYNGYGIAFSAPSGTGKSTHTQLWQEIYGRRVQLINDDTPAIRFQKGCATIFGLPWSGSTGLNNNCEYPLKAVICLERGKENNITRLDSKTAIYRILNETTKPYYPEMMPVLLRRVEKLILSTPVYLLQCNTGKQAVEVVKSELF